MTALTQQLVADVIETNSVFFQLYSHGGMADSGAASTNESACTGATRRLMDRSRACVDGNAQLPPRSRHARPHDNRRTVLAL